MGHIIFERGVEVELKKVEAITQWPRPTSITEIHSFLGLASYYWRFIRDISRISTLMTRLTQKKVKFL